VLGFKRLCNPISPTGAPGYFTSTIAGMKQYCDGFAALKTQTAAAMAQYINSHDISGVTAPNDNTIVFTLTAPASDFLYILTLPFSSAAPKEYLDYVPDSAQFRAHTISDGPYAITSYTAGKEIKLAKNPAWTQSSDPLRHQYVNAIDVVEGQASDAAVQQQLQAGTADLSWDLPVPTASIPALQAAKDPNFGVYPTPDTNPYLVFNLLSPNNGGALGKVKVRQALEYAVDKVAIGKIYGGPTLNTPLGQVIPPGNSGYVKFDPYATPNSAGDPAKCKSLLSAAGYPNGLTLTDVARNAGNHPAVAQSVQADFAKCGVTTKIVPVSQGDYYGKYLNDPKATKAGTWDISEPGWVPDWFGNNGRSIVVPLFDGRTYGPNSTDYGDYNSPTVNALIDKALAAPDEQTAATYWHEADVAIMGDAPFIPFETQKTPLYHSSRVKNAVFSPFMQTFDMTNLWLAQ
jgi:peptide/nickel transport system substrate-binding protein